MNCNLILKELNFVLEDLQLLINLTHNNTYSFDQVCLETLKIVSNDCTTKKLQNSLNVNFLFLFFNLNF